MSRVIKFRAWDSVRNKMFTNPEWVSFHVDFEGQLTASNYDPKGHKQHLKVMQFTGLRDVNGIEIYEGDLITAESYPFYSDGELNYIAEVLYIDDPDYLGWYYALHQVSDRVRGSACGSGLPDLVGLKLTVIGNIYKNPELLKE